MVWRKSEYPFSVPTYICRHWSSFLKHLLVKLSVLPTTIQVITLAEPFACHLRNKIKLQIKVSFWGSSYLNRFVLKRSANVLNYLFIHSWLYLRYIVGKRKIDITTKAIATDNGIHFCLVRFRALTGKHMLFNVAKYLPPSRKQHFHCVVLPIHLYSSNKWWYMVLIYWPCSL